MRSAELKAVVFFNNSEGKAHSGLMRFRMRRVELYLARAHETKGVCAGGANTLVTSVLGRGVSVGVMVGVLTAVTGYRIPVC